MHREKPLVTPTPQGVQVLEGKVQSTVGGEIVITTADNQTVNLALNETTQVFDIGNSASTTRGVIRSGFTVRAVGEFSTSDTLIASSIRVIIAPNVFVATPSAGDEIGLPLAISGEARAFENTVNMRVRDADGRILGETFGTARAIDIGQYGPFDVAFSYKTPNYTTGTVEVFTISAKDGEEEQKVIVPITFKQIESRDVKVFFSSTKYDGLECEATYPAIRRVASTSGIARAALEELLRGPDVFDLREGFLTSIPDGVVIQKLVIEDGVAKVDFSAALENYGGGSCRVAAIHSQIRETLMQFPTIENVVVSIDGRVEDILQP